MRRRSRCGGRTVTEVHYGAGEPSRPETHGARVPSEAYGLGLQRGSSSSEYRGVRPHREVPRARKDEEGAFSGTGGKQEREQSETLPQGQACRRWANPVSQVPAGSEENMSCRHRCNRIEGIRHERLAGRCKAFHENGLLADKKTDRGEHIASFTERGSARGRLRLPSPADASESGHTHFQQEFLDCNSQSSSHTRLPTPSPALPPARPRAAVSFQTCPGSPR